MPVFLTIRYFIANHSAITIMASSIIPIVTTSGMTHIGRDELQPATVKKITLFIAL